MSLSVGDRVHFPRVGTGVVVEVRNGGHVRVEIKGRTMASQLEPAEPVRRRHGALRATHG